MVNSVFQKEDLLRLIKEKEIYVNNIQLLENALEQLDDEEIKLLYQTLQYVLDKSKEKSFFFSIEVYESGGDLPNLYLVLYPSKKYKNNEEYIESIISNIENYIEQIDKEFLLWFVGVTNGLSTNNIKIQKFFSKLQKYNIKVDNEKALKSFLTKIKEEDVDALCEIVEYLQNKINNNLLQHFSIEMFGPYDDDLEEFYFILSFREKTKEEETEDILIELSNYTCNKYPSLCSFVGFARK